MRTCQRVVTERSRVGYCHREATHISPKGRHTGRIIDVCPVHKAELTNLHQAHKEDVVFTLIVKRQNIPVRRAP